MAFYNERIQVDHGEMIVEKVDHLLARQVRRQGCDCCESRPSHVFCLVMVVIDVIQVFVQLPGRIVKIESVYSIWGRKKGGVKKQGPWRGLINVRALTIFFFLMLYFFGLFCMS